MTRIDDTKAAKERATQGVARRLLRILSDPLEHPAGMLFHPAGNLQPEAAAGHWRSEGFDSYFYVPMRCEAGLLLVSFDATLCDTGIDHRDHWRLYFDIGEGFREEDCLVINCSGTRIEIETTISLPAPVLAFRIDPCEQSGRFVLHKLALTPLAASQPPSDNIPHQLPRLRRWGALLRKMAAAARLAQRGRWRRQRQSTVPLSPTGTECGAWPMPRALEQHFIARCRTSTIAPGALSCLALLLAAVVGGSFHWWLARGNGAREFDGFRQVRIKTIQAQLDQVEGPYIVIMGDSHAERLYLSRLCDLPVVNAGISGATISDVLDLSRAITLRHKASALLLSVGTNDIWAKRGPETDHAEGAFQAGLVALKSRLTMWSDHRAFVAIPPVASNEEKQFPRSAAERYSGMLARSCKPSGCIYLDLFAEAQRPIGPRSAFSDGVHLRDYAGFVRARERELCFGLSLES